MGLKSLGIKDGGFLFFSFEPLIWGKLTTTLGRAPRAGPNSEDPGVTLEAGPPAVKPSDDFSPREHHNCTQTCS